MARGEATPQPPWIARVARCFVRARLTSPLRQLQSARYVSSSCARRTGGVPRVANARPPASFHVTRPAGPRAHFHLLPLDGPLAPNRARKVVVYVLPSRPRALRSRFLRCKGVQKRRCTRPSWLGGRAGPILITRPSRPSHAPWGSRNASSMKRSAPHGFVGAPRRPEGRHPGCDEVAMTSAREVSC